MQQAGDQGGFVEQCLRLPLQHTDGDRDSIRGLTRERDGAEPQADDDQNHDALCCVYPYSPLIWNESRVVSFPSVLLI